MQTAYSDRAAALAVIATRTHEFVALAAYSDLAMLGYLLGMAEREAVDRIAADARTEVRAA